MLELQSTQQYATPRKYKEMPLKIEQNQTFAKHGFRLYTAGKAILKEFFVSTNFNNPKKKKKKRLTPPKKTRVLQLL